MNQIVEMEFRIISTLVDELLGHGFKLSVHDGEEWTVTASDHKQEVLRALHTVDNNGLRATHPDGTMGAVFLVYGNSGWDVICDYTPILDPYLTKTFELIDKLEAQG